MHEVHSVDHINIVVRDMERSLKFYCGLLGLPKVREARLEGGWIESIVGLKGVAAHVVYVQPEGGGPRIELLQYDAPEGKAFESNSAANTVGLRHIALRVSDANGLYERLKANGVHFFSPLQSVPGGVISHDAGRKSLCYFLDPDGVILELAQYDAD